MPEGVQGLVKLSATQETDELKSFCQDISHILLLSKESLPKKKHLSRTKQSAWPHS